MSEVVSTQKVDDLGLWNIGDGLAGDTELQSIDSTNIIVKHVEAIPVVLLVDQICVVLEHIDVVHDSWSIGSLQSQRMGREQRCGG